jgi:hypothetical protein
MCDKNWVETYLEKKMDGAGGFNVMLASARLLDAVSARIELQTAR